MENLAIACYYTQFHSFLSRTRWRGSLFLFQFTHEFCPFILTIGIQGSHWLYSTNPFRIAHFHFARVMITKQYPWRLKIYFIQPSWFLHTDYLISRQLIIKFSVILDFFICSYLRPKIEKKKKGENWKRFWFPRLSFPSISIITIVNISFDTELFHLHFSNDHMKNQRKLLFH